MNEHNHCYGPGYASPVAAMQAEPEQVLYTIAIYTGTGIEEPDYLTPCATNYEEIPPQVMRN